MKAFITLLVLSVLILMGQGCVREEKKYMAIDQDFCSKIHIENVKLSSYLDPLDSLMKSKTGVYSLEEGDHSMIARAWLSESAEKSIDIQYFIFSADNVGLIAIDYLLRAADRGVQVRILVDDIMVEADADELLALDAHPNLSIRIYNPTTNIGKNLPQKLYSLTSEFLGFNQRMHNKTFVVDGRVAITGGRNIADEYFDYDHEYNFRDRDVLLIGETVHTIQSSFDQFWSSKLSIPIDSLLKLDEAKLNVKGKYEYLHQYACNPLNFWPQVRERITDVPIVFEKMTDSGELRWVDRVDFVSDIPGKNDAGKTLKGGGASTDELIKLVKSAKSSIYIQSPYLVTTELSQKLFLDAVKRGVKVSILTNSLCSTDNLEAFSGYQRDRQKLLYAGIDIYEFKPDAAIRYKVMTGSLQEKLDYAPIFGLHAKSMVIDDQIAVIGTFNLDPRSANLNTECIAVIYDNTIAQSLRKSMEIDQKEENAWKTTTTFNPDQFASWSKRFQVWTRHLVPKSIL